MKKFFVLFLVAAVLTTGCVVFSACSASDTPPLPMSLRDGMSVEDVFDLLDRSFSYSIVVGDEDYRFIRGKGYTKFEEGVFDALVEEEGVGYRMTDRDGVSVTRVPLNREFFDEIDYIYSLYVQKLRDSFKDFSANAPLEFRPDESGYRVVVWLTERQGMESVTVRPCEICNVNCTALFYPKEFKNFKSLATNG